MSRGRRLNRIYVPAPDDLERQEVAPRVVEAGTAAEALARGLAICRTQVAAIDLRHAGATQLLGGWPGAIGVKVLHPGIAHHGDDRRVRA
jgi:hypothetical protein